MFKDYIVLTSVIIAYLFLSVIFLEYLFKGIDMSVKRNHLRRQILNGVLFSICYFFLMNFQFIHSEAFQSHLQILFVMTASFFGIIPVVLVTMTIYGVDYIQHNFEDIEVIYFLYGGMSLFFAKQNFSMLRKSVAIIISSIAFSYAIPTDVMDRENMLDSNLYLLVSEVVTLTRCAIKMNCSKKKAKKATLLYRKLTNFLRLEY